MNLVREKIQNLFIEILSSTAQVPFLPWDLVKPSQLVIAHPSELKNIIIFFATYLIGTLYCYVPSYLSFPFLTFNKYMTYFPTRLYP